MAEYISPNHGRKHRIHADIDIPLRPMKRARLETMLENLTLQSEAESSRPKPNLQINPLIEPFEPEVKKRKTTRLDDLIQQKMAETYKEQMLQGLAMIRHIHPLAILIRHFQRWIKRLFNLFVSKYNDRNGGQRRMKPFKSFARIMALTQDGNVAFTYENLLNIVLEENTLEIQRLILKREMKLDNEKLQEIKDEEEIARESSYTYWDRVSALSGDIDMDDYGSAEYTIQPSPQFWGSDLEMANEVEDPMLANYGNYSGFPS